MSKSRASQNIERDDTASILKKATQEMADRLPFIDAIRQSPYEQTPKRIYADWLEERGELNLAENIRLCADMEEFGEDDPRYVIAKARLHWNGPCFDFTHHLPQSLVMPIDFLQGLGQNIMMTFSHLDLTPNELSQLMRLVPANNFSFSGMKLEHAKLLTATLPKHSVRFFTADGDCTVEAIQELFTSPIIGPTLSLHLGFSFCEHFSKKSELLPHFFDVLFDHVHLENITIQCNQGLSWPVKNFTKALKKMENSPIKKLNLSGPGWGNRHIRLLLDSPLIRQLEELNLVCTKINQQTCQQLLGVGPSTSTSTSTPEPLDQLKTLNLAGSTYPTIGEDLAQSSRFPHVRTLEINGVGLEHSQFSALIEGDGLPELRRLLAAHNELSYDNESQNQSYGSLPDCRKPLFELSVANNRACHLASSPLVSWPFLQSLVKLDLSDCKVSPEAIRALLQDRVYHRLAHLCLGNNPNSDQMYNYLCDFRSSLPAIQSLDFQGLFPFYPPKLAASYQGKLKTNPMWRGE